MLNLRLKRRNAIPSCIPNHFILYLVIAVNNPVAHPDGHVCIWNGSRKIRIIAQSLIERFADDL